MKSRSLLLAVIALLAIHFSHAQIPHTLSYQGIFADTAGTPKPDGLYNFTFRLYTISSGGSAMWSETKSAQVKRGLFSTILGSLTPLPDSVKFDRQYWLGVQVASDPELSPRMQLTSVGSSINSLRSDTAQAVPNNSITAGKIASGQVVKSVNNLHDAVTLRAQGGATITSNGDTLTINAGSGGGGTGIQGIQNTDNALSIANPGGPTATVNLRIPFTVNGNMGVGTTTPQGLLDINSGSGGSDVSAVFVRSDPGVFGRGGIIHHQSSAYAWQELAQTTSSATDGYLTFHYVNRATPGTKLTSNVLTLRGNGNVGIGTTTPTSRLEIAAQDGLAITGFQPFLTFRDANSGNVRGIIQSVGGALNLFTNGYLIGTNPSGFLQLNNNGNVGIGVIPPVGEKLDVNGGNGSGANIAIHGSSNDNYGVYGTSNTSFGVFGESGSSPGIRARTYNPSSYALFADYSASSTNFCGLSSNDYAIYANGPSFFSGTVYIGSNTTNYISGNLHITGQLDVSGSKNFRIDHPLDPANKTLSHSCIESNERLLMYSGTVVTDGGGNVTIQLPSYFEALNINYRYQLTIVGEEFAQARVSREISNNQFSIKTDKPNIKVCWQVTGDRNDAYSKANPYVVEEEKKPEDRGKYLAPELFGQPNEKAIGYRPPPAHQQTDHASPPFPAEKERQ